MPKSQILGELLIPVNNKYFLSLFFSNSLWGFFVEELHAKLDWKLKPLLQIEIFFSQISINVEKIAQNIIRNEERAFMIQEIAQRYLIIH